MHLVKFYADVVTPAGAGCIVYAARVNGWGMTATVGATLSWREHATVALPHQERTFRGTLPEPGDDHLSWRCPALAVNGTWTEAAPKPLPQLRWQNGTHRLEWDAFLPCAQVDLQAGESRLRGRGYAERLTLDFSPLSLPIDVLRWGRFVSATHSVIWIEWQGEACRRWVWHDGVLVAEANIADTHVSWPGCHLGFGNARSLRSGRIGDTVFARWPRARRWVPGAIQGFQEAKWCATGTLTGSPCQSEHGWVIHETVRFR